MSSANREEWRDLKIKDIIFISLVLGFILSSVISLLCYFVIKSDSPMIILIGGMLASILSGVIFNMINDYSFKNECNKEDIISTIKEDHKRLKKEKEMNEDIEKIKKEMKSFKMLR